MTDNYFFLFLFPSPYSPKRLLRFFVLHSDGGFDISSDGSYLVAYVHMKDDEDMKFQTESDDTDMGVVEPSTEVEAPGAISALLAYSSRHIFTSRRF